MVEITISSVLKVRGLPPDLRETDINDINDINGGIRSLRSLMS